MRSIIPTHDFAQPSEESLGDAHKKMAKAKRTTDMLENQSTQGPQLILQKPQENNAEHLKVEDQSLFGANTDLHPIIFEECYVKDVDPNFVKIVKS